MLLTTIFSATSKPRPKIRSPDSQITFFLKSLLHVVLDENTVFSKSNPGPKLCIKARQFATSNGFSVKSLVR